MTNSVPDPKLTWHVTKGAEGYVHKMELTNLDAAVLWSLGYQVTRDTEDVTAT